MNIQGTGLGLNIVKRYIDILEGSIRFESVQGREQSFILRFCFQIHFRNKAFEDQKKSPDLKDVGTSH